jgi:hypothetical protein
MKLNDIKFSKEVLIRVWHVRSHMFQFFSINGLNHYPLENLWNDAQLVVQNVVVRIGSSNMGLSMVPKY